MIHDAAKSLLLPHHHQKWQPSQVQNHDQSEPSFRSTSFHKSLHKTNTTNPLTDLQYAKPRNLVPIFLFWPPIHSLSPLAAASVRRSPAMLWRISTTEAPRSVCFVLMTLHLQQIPMLCRWCIGDTERESRMWFFFFFFLRKSRMWCWTLEKEKKHFGWLVFFKAFRCYICHVSLVYLKMGENWRYLNGRWASPVQLHP